MFVWPNPEGLGYPVSQITKASWNIWPVKKKNISIRLNSLIFQLHVFLVHGPSSD